MGVQLADGGHVLEEAVAILLGLQGEQGLEKPVYSRGSKFTLIHKKGTSFNEQP